VATHQEDVAQEEMQQRVEAMVAAQKYLLLGVDSAERRATHL
jgi:hypothetical protein